MVSVSTLERVESTILPSLYTIPFYDFDLRASHARTLLPAALASVPFGFVLVRVRVRVSVADHVAAWVISRERRGRIVSKFHTVESIPKSVSKSIDRTHLVNGLLHLSAFHIVVTTFINIACAPRGTDRSTVARSKYFLLIEIVRQFPSSHASNYPHLVDGNDS